MYNTRVLQYCNTRCTQVLHVYYPGTYMCTLEYGYRYTCTLENTGSMVTMFVTIRYCNNRPYCNIYIMYMYCSSTGSMHTGILEYYLFTIAIHVYTCTYSSWYGLVLALGASEHRYYGTMVQWLVLARISIFCTVHVRNILNHEIVLPNAIEYCLGVAN